jgi:chromosome partitioning protein
VANLIIQPVGASLDDLNPAIREFNGLLKARIDKSKLNFILNRISSPAEEKATRNYLEKASYFVFTNYLPEKISYREAQNEGLSISEVKYLRLRKQAQLLIKEVIKKIGTI